MSGIKAEIIADSLNAATGDRLTTFIIRVPKWLLTEIARHRSLSINAASSRAIPAKKVRRQVLQDPFIPIHFGKSGRGMQAHGELPPVKVWLAKTTWLLARYPIVGFHWFLGDILGLAKEATNRLLEPWMWADVLLTGTEWKNFFVLRCHEDAQPEFREAATQMRELYQSHAPQVLQPGDWHLPWVKKLERHRYSLEMLKQISAARCARTSYLLPEGGFSTPERDLELCAKLVAPPLHASPFENVALALPTSERTGNFVGWKQQRKFFENESNGDYCGVEAQTA